MINKQTTIYDKAQEDLREVDIYRDTAVRYLGKFYNSLYFDALSQIGCRLSE